MKRFSFNLSILILFCGLILTGCWIDEVNEPGPGPGPDSTSVFGDVSSDHLPVDNLNDNSTTAKAADLDNDGDLDLVVAVEFEPNKILINDGNGNFTDESARRLPAQNFASEDVAIADFNQDGFLDLFFANLSDLTDTYYLNDGNGSFSDARTRLPFTGSSYAVLAADINNDGAPDLILGNDGQNSILINNGRGFFSDQSATRLPEINDVSRDLALADVDGNGSLDLIVANEISNRIQLNFQGGFFVDRTQTLLPLLEGVEQTRDINVGDVDDDGRPDLYFGNAILFKSGETAQDQLLINEQRRFVNVTDNQLPPANTNTIDADFLDIDNDGDLDIITSDFGSLDNITGNFSGANFARVLINNGAGSFSYATKIYFPLDFSPKTNDFEIADYDGDGLLDIYVANFNTPDVLLLRRK